MSYTKQTWQTGDTITAEKLNHIEDGVDDLNRHLSDLEDSISDAYDATASYAVGDFCINENTLYRCNTAIPTGGEVWTPAHWDAVQIVDLLGSGGGGAVNDVQINGTSILSNGVANIPITGPNRPGVMIVNEYNGHNIINGILVHKAAAIATIKRGTEPNEPIVANNQHQSTFYGLAKAAGSDEKDSTLAFGTYTEAAKTAIRAMLGVTDASGGMNVITLTGTTITQTAAENTMYKCGELAELTFTAPASGITAVRFSSGSTPTVASFPGVTWLGDFDPDNLLSNVTYEINIFDGVGVAGWA